MRLTITCGVAVESLRIRPCRIPEGTETVSAGFAWLMPQLQSSQNSNMAARDRAERTASSRVRPASVFALDRGPRSRALPVLVYRSERRISNDGCILSQDRNRDRGWPSNLTPGPATGLGDWPSEQIIRAIRYGQWPDGRTLSPLMPWPEYAHPQLFLPRV